MKNSVILKKFLALATTVALLACLLTTLAGCFLLLAPPKLDRIAATYKGPDLFVGQNLNKSDIEVTAYYTDDSSKKVTDFTVSELDSTAVGTQYLTVSYTEDNVTRKYPITVEVIPVVAISLVAVYNGGEIEIGEQPDMAQLEVTVFYNNESSKLVTNFTVGSVDSSTEGVKDWQIFYVEDGVQISTAVEITVKKADDGGNDGPVGDDPKVADMSIHFMELGYNSNGDSIYIKAGETDILIDAGSEKGSAATITKYIDQYCTDGKLEYVIATHADSDHINAFVGTKSATGILDYYDCETIIQFARTGKNTTVLGEYRSKVATLQDEGTNVYSALDCVKEENGAQKVYELADGITMEILYQKYYETNTSNENDYSVCIMFTQGDNHYLFLGDLEENGEKSLIECNPNLPKVEMYKAGHHGSKTSANDVLLNVIQPQYVLISCVAGNVEYLTTGEQNLHNAFPTQDFINRIAPYTDKVYVTGQTTIKLNDKGRWQNDTYSPLNGNIVFSCIDGVIEVHCTNNDVLLKDSDWFKANRDFPAAWQ